MVASRVALTSHLTARADVQNAPVVQLEAQGAVVFTVRDTKSGVEHSRSDLDVPCLDIDQRWTIFTDGSILAVPEREPRICTDPLQADLVRGVARAFTIVLDPPAYLV
jgi:hypothetical protein